MIKDNKVLNTEETNSNNEHNKEENINLFIKTLKKSDDNCSCIKTKQAFNFQAIIILIKLACQVQN